MSGISKRGSSWELSCWFSLYEPLYWAVNSCGSIISPSPGNTILILFRLSCNYLRFRLIWSSIIVSSSSWSIALSFGLTPELLFSTDSGCSCKIFLLEEGCDLTTWVLGSSFFTCWFLRFSLLLLCLSDFWWFATSEDCNCCSPVPIFWFAGLVVLAEFYCAVSFADTLLRWFTGLKTTGNLEWYSQ